MTVRSISPLDGSMIKEMEEASSTEIREALQRARRAQRDWFQRTTREDRIAMVRELGSVCRKAKDEVVDLIHLECGFPREVIAASYGSAVNGIEHYVREYEGWREEFPLDPAAWKGSTARIEMLPHGVIGHIGVWNFPFWQTMISAIPGLLVGNGFVYKPSELSTLSGLRISRLIHEAGYPEDLYPSVVGGPSVGREMVTSGFDALVFTGSMEAGQDIAARAGVMPLILELSGNDAAIVREDADLEMAARGIASGSFARAGQICIRIKRVFVHEEVASELTERVVDIAAGLRREDVGPLIREEARRKVDRVVRDAVANGAELLHGGRDWEGPGFFYEPTVLTVQDQRSEVVRRETFGPVCPIQAVKDDEEAIQLANDTPYGLGATIWTSDYDAGESLAKRLEVGNVWINDCIRTLPCGELFQGWKQSGIPSSQRRLEMFAKKRTVITRRSCDARPTWFGGA
ncbi:MAG TPA: aldehyde dehydrogenase family protein [Methanomassiliicoccaceae archaeon]|jgi:succinate-semialdehyde dehydrogenase/glutarate-semialdehyde dehydrogenase|nr:aldehyde dehydrogenase [Euryarchaeota archaeon]HOB38285.1 aldehyde dehydrogenase family protein [Methanomassiliicoccaceae archaeon]HOK28140.1 aldehyde dehydrogenase family protein [Methanomassiliicoccaceae archaeon]HQA20726.1 aldehyde dehydrogenase family protein [Methanomassiliicoccaceae archaeon]